MTANFGQAAASGLGSLYSSLPSLSTVTSTLSNLRTSAVSSSSSSSGKSRSELEDALLTRDLDRLFHAKIRPILDCRDKLSVYLSDDTNIKLPNIVVVGDQSSGKSSVLEALSGISLPRGSAITTRVPLVLRLVNTMPDDFQQDQSSSSALASSLSSSSSTSSLPSAALSSSSSTASTLPAAYATISAAGIAEERIRLEDVPASITRLTARLAGPSVAVANTPIQLTVYRPYSPDLTLVDLPGITRNPVGDQPRDIEKQIKAMIHHYIKQEETVILAVMPASIDLVTCECRAIAREVDPSGKRTVAVVTKMDTVDKERGINSRLRAAVDQLGLDLGLVAVRNRAQHESDEGRTWEQAREEEINFFKNHPELAQLLTEAMPPLAVPSSSSSSSSSSSASSSSSPSPSPRPQLGSGSGRILLGTGMLASLLTSIQEQQIRSVLPRVRRQVGELLNNARGQMRELPEALASEREARMRFENMLSEMMSRITRVCEGDRAFISKADGGVLTATELNLPARLLDLYRALERDLSAQSSPSRYLSAEFARAVEREMKENVGISLPNVASPQVVISLIHTELERSHTPSLAVIEQSRLIHANIINKICKQIFKAYPKLQDTIIAQQSEFVNKCAQNAQQRVEEALAQEQDVFTACGWYEDTCRKVRSSIAELRAASNAGKLRSGDNVITVNELRFNVDASLLSNSNGSQAGNELILETQINVLAYVSLSTRRLIDRCAQIVRFHFSRLISTTGAHGLRQELCSSWSAVPDAVIMDQLKESAELATKREAIRNTIDRLEKAMKLFEAL